jgi:uracil-DNA glycosylase
MSNTDNNIDIPNDWLIELKKSISTPDLLKPLEFIKQKRMDDICIFPSDFNIFNAFKMCSFKNTKVVVFGQDPYHQEGFANGLAFSVNIGNKIPASLRNIYTEIETDLGSLDCSSGDLEGWARQGVLLLNSALSVEQSKPGSHADIGWDKLINSVINSINLKGGVVFLLWGAHAISKRNLIDERINHVLTAPHPSPLSAYRGFFGCKHFSKTNELLANKKLAPITW